MANTQHKVLGVKKETVCRLSEKELTGVDGGSSWACVGVGFVAYTIYDVGTRIGAKMKQATW